MTKAEISKNTKTKLSNSLRNLLNIKSFSKISVDDVANDCEIHRSTFYYHFCDMNALFKWTIAKDAFEVLKEARHLSDSDAAINYLLDYVEENRKLLKRACECLGYHELKDYFYSDMKSVVDAYIEEMEKTNGVRMPHNDKEFWSQFITEGFMGSLLGHIDNPIRCNRSDMVHNTNLLVACFNMYLSK